MEAWSEFWDHRQTGLISPFVLSTEWGELFQSSFWKKTVWQRKAPRREGRLCVRVCACTHTDK